MKSRRVVIGGAVVAIILALAGGMWLLRDRGPTYQGESVHDWVRGLALNPSSDEAEKALQSMGTNALPYLAKAVQRKRTWLGNVYKRAWLRSPAIIREGLREPLPLGRLRKRSVSTIEEIGQEIRWEHPIAETEPPPQLTVAVKALGKVLSYPSSELRTSAAQALAYIGPASAPAVPQLTELVKEGSPREKKRAAMALGTIGPKAADAVPALRQALKGARQDVRLQVLQALSSIGPDGRPALPQIVKDLDAQDESLRRAAAQAVATIGEVPSKARPQLEALLDDESESVRSAAAVAVWHTDPYHERSKEMVLRFLQDPEERIRRSATANLVKWMGSKAEPAVPVLTDLLDDEEKMVRLFAFEALTRIAPEVAERHKEELYNRR